jgi:hypothetical protein
MKVTVIPAQVTTVEDRIAGSLGLSQLLLLSAPVFLGSALFVMLPPNFHYALYKLIIVALLCTFCAIMAIRIRGQIILFWMITLVKYNLRPRYYIFDKQSNHGRKEHKQALPKEDEEKLIITKQQRKALSLSISDVIRLNSLIENPAANFRLETKKGGLYVRITEVKQES